MSEVLFILVMGGAFIVPWVYYKQKRWAWFFGAVMIVLGLFELEAKLSTGMTLSQQFWALHKTNQSAGWIIVGSISLGWIALILHLVGKALKRKRK